ncbi:hypothetical protein BXY85_0495 [Roseivirga pacifica]|uniref:Uncharacterized protein n=1 Tax=Roseivirga pacifica TaxID=1267423 RepID=A0A1I0REU3_9BACT|nr:DUF6728 family protein [Roseivirga pacifica]RKQ49506.1 hypothetical protein BXY85_0495 [Roseivirga pacifica]SEW39412.1 hypothetical protein SAMN05216290_3441 [Roseivirga pacifica]SEW44446.1 hypothetical protein SAMN05216290_4084 [Roseivirga pacifica]
MVDDKEKNERGEKVKLSAKEAFDFSPVLGYFFRKKDPNNRPNFNLRVMHGINKISIIMFLIALTVMIARYFTR